MRKTARYCGCFPDPSMTWVSSKFIAKQFVQFYSIESVSMGLVNSYSFTEINLFLGFSADNATVSLHLRTLFIYELLLFTSLFKYISPRIPSLGSTLSPMKELQQWRIIQRRRLRTTCIFGELQRNRRLDWASQHAPVKWIDLKWSTVHIITSYTVFESLVPRSWPYGTAYILYRFIPLPSQQLPACLLSQSEFFL